MICMTLSIVHNRVNKQAGLRVQMPSGRKKVSREDNKHVGVVISTARVASATSFLTTATSLLN